MDAPEVRDVAEEVELVGDDRQPRRLSQRRVVPAHARPRPDPDPDPTPTRPRPSPRRVGRTAQEQGSRSTVGNRMIFRADILERTFTVRRVCSAGGRIEPNRYCIQNPTMIFEYCTAAAAAHTPPTTPPPPPTPSHTRPIPAWGRGQTGRWGFPSWRSIPSTAWDSCSWRTRHWAPLKPGTNEPRISEKININWLVYISANITVCVTRVLFKFKQAKLIRVFW